MTSHPNVIKKRSHYLMGGCLIDEFYKDGVDGYISFVGHTPTGNVIWTDQGLYLDDDLKSIWKNEKENSCYRFSNGVASITSDNK